MWAWCGEYNDWYSYDAASFPFTVTAPRMSNGEYDSWVLEGNWEDAEIPDELGLPLNYPNPFNANTTISYNLPTGGNVTLDVYNLMGRKVTTLTDGWLKAGKHNIIFDASDYSSGIYFYILTTGDETISRRMTLLK